MRNKMSKNLTSFLLFLCCSFLWPTVLSQVFLPNNPYFLQVFICYWILGHCLQKTRYSSNLVQKTKQDKYLEDTWIKMAWGEWADLEGHDSSWKNQILRAERGVEEPARTIGIVSWRDRAKNREFEGKHWGRLSRLSFQVAIKATISTLPKKSKN